jgi:hypothetical protein
MKLLELKVVAILTLFALCLVSRPAYSQNNDVEGTELLLKLFPLERHSVGALQKRLKEDWSIEDRSLGFGARRVTFEKGITYTSIYVEALVFRGEWVSYEAGVKSYSTEWPRMRTFVIETWKERGGPSFAVDEHRVFCKQTNGERLEAFKKAVSATLGKLKEVSARTEWQDDYQYLLSPLNEVKVADGGCGLPPGSPQGKEAIDRLVSGKQLDLIENVVRGYNPGGRVYAALALLEMKRKGLRLRPSTKRAISEVMRMPTPISICAGCIVSTAKARDVASLLGLR